MEIGIDIIEINRIKKACERKSFSRRVFTYDELEQIKNKASVYSHLAGKFAAKEAVSKALGTGFRFFKWHDIQIINNHVGKPIVKLSGKAKQIFENNRYKHIKVTISHSRDYAVAFAVILRGDDVEDCKS
ncbi:MAG TPA: holo-ACP synthase [Thermoanaerobacterales bacterium]|nr:holo-ACP synthase [Thermoanaerobacterales bacterium]